MFNIWKLTVLWLQDSIYTKLVWIARNPSTLPELVMNQQVKCYFLAYKVFFMMIVICRKKFLWLAPYRRQNKNNFVIATFREIKLKFCTKSTTGQTTCTHIVLLSSFLCFSLWEWWGTWNIQILIMVCRPSMLSKALSSKNWHLRISDCSGSFTIILISY